MAFESLANEFTTTLAGTITAGASSLVLASTIGTGINPCPTAPFRLRIDDELILVGARVGTTCSSLSRGVESTTAATHADASVIRQVLTVAGLDAAVGHPSGIGINVAPVAGQIFVSESGNAVTHGGRAQVLLTVANDTTYFQQLSLLNETYSTDVANAGYLTQYNNGEVDLANDNFGALFVGPTNSGVSTYVGNLSFSQDNVTTGDIVFNQDSTAGKVLFEVDGSGGIEMSANGGGVVIDALTDITITAQDDITITSVGDLALVCGGTFSVPTAISSGSLKSSSPSGGIGYATGAGGASSQSTNKSTTVTAAPNPSICGSITMNNAALNAGVIVSFTFTNSAIAITDVLVLNHISGGTIGAYTLNAQCAAGSATINVRNATVGNLSDAVVIQYALVRAVNA